MSNQGPNYPPAGGPDGRGRQTPANNNMAPTVQGMRVAGQQAGPGRRERQALPNRSPQWIAQPNQGATPVYPPTASYGQPQPIMLAPMQEGASLAAPVRGSHAATGFAVPMPATEMNILVARVGAVIGALTFAASLLIVALSMTHHSSGILYTAGAFVFLPITALFSFVFWQTAQFASEKQRQTIRQAGQQTAGGAAPQPNAQPAYAPPGAPQPQPRPVPQPAQQATPQHAQPPQTPEVDGEPTSPQLSPEYAPYAPPIDEEPTIEAIPFKHLDPAQFEDHEPDQSEGDRVEHTASVAELGDGNWAVLGVSLRGLSHKHDAKFREDAIAGVTVGGWQLGVVADGGGAYHLSRVGSNVGARAALQGMRAKLRDLARTPGAASTEGMYTVLHAGYSQAYEALAEEAKTRGVAPRDMYTTLLLVAHLDLGSGRHLVGGAQVGDGAVVARTIAADGQRNLTRLNTPDIGAANNETVFFQSVSPDDWQNRIFAQVVEGAQCYCLAMTDGIADDFTPLERELVRLEEPLFRDVLAGKKSPRDAVPAVESLLDYRRPGSFDDRSLVCIYNTRERPWK